MMVLMMIADAMLRKKERRRCEFWEQMSKAQMAVMKEAIADNQKAFELLAQATKRFIGLGESPDDYIDWMKRSAAMSVTWKERAARIGELLEKAP